MKLTNMPGFFATQSFVLDRLFIACNRGSNIPRSKHSVDMRRLVRRVRVRELLSDTVKNVRTKQPHLFVVSIAARLV